MRLNIFHIRAESSWYIFYVQISAKYRIHNAIALACWRKKKLRKPITLGWANWILFALWTNFILLGCFVANDEHPSLGRFGISAARCPPFQIEAMLFIIRHAVWPKLKYLIVGLSNGWADNCCSTKFYAFSHEQVVETERKWLFAELSWCKWSDIMHRTQYRLHNQVDVFPHHDAKADVRHHHQTFLRSRIWLA